MDSIENENIKYYLKDGILFGIYKQDATIDLEGAKQLVKDRHQLTKGKKYPLFLDTRNVKSVTKEARDFLAADDSISDMSAGAIIIGSKITKIIGNFFLNINKPKVIAKIFTSEEEAISWLSGFIEK